MPFFDPIRIGASGAAADFTVDRSLRYNPADITNLERTFGSASNRRTWTFSFWTKRCGLGRTSDIFSPYRGGDGSQESRLYFQDTDKLRLYDSGGNSGYPIITSSAVFRDVNAWYHFVVAVDTTQSTASNRVKMYANGVLQELSETTYGNQNQQLGWNNNNIHRVGAYGYTAQGSLSSSNIYDGYLAEVNFIDGQQLTPSSFGETNSTTGQWVPIDTSGLTFGTNGFRLQFADNSGTTATTLGKDTSGNSNNFTPSNFAVSDAVKDSPTNNFCTFNTLSNYDGLTLAEGNLKATSSSSWKQTRGTMGVSSGKWYFEIRCNSIAATEGWIAGIHEMFGRDTDGYYWYNNSYTAAGFGYAYGVQDNNQKRGNTSSMDGSFSSDVTAGKVVGIRMNLDDNEILISVDGVDKGKMYDIQSGKTYTPAVNIYGSSSATLNCGQDSTFHGQESSGGNTDSGGIGDFAYAVPSGYKALCSANLPDPTILLPDKYFETLLYTGSGSSSLYNVTGLEFQPDWVWGKSRNDVIGHILFDAVRGDDRQLEANLTDAEVLRSSAAYRFLSNGFAVSTVGNLNNPVNYVAWNWNAGDTDGKTYTVKVVSDSGNKYRFDDFGTSAVTLDLAEGGTYIFDQSDSSNSGHPLRFSTTSNGTHGGGSEYTTGVTTSGTPGSSGAYTQIVVAASAPTLYYYCTQHSGMGGQANTNSTLGSSNFDGSRQATTKVNTTAGFSIVTSTAGGSSSGVYDSFGHGLGVAPNVIIFKNREATDRFYVFNSNLSSANDKRLALNEDTPENTTSNLWGTSLPTSSTFSIDQAGYSLGAGNKIIAYCFSEVAGYSKFGSYTGNGSTDGTFIFLGFRPAWFLLKRSDTSASWLLYDNKRDPDNRVAQGLFPNTSGAETEQTGGFVDFVSNGVKLREDGSAMNASGGTFIYLAFAESPFKNARAR